MDFNNTFGTNEFHYFIKGTLNATLGIASPTDFDAGGHTITQNTTSINFTQNFDVLEGLNVAFGGEYRTENFTIFAGEEGSYAFYDVNGVPADRNTPDENRPRLGDELRPGGSQGFPGYSPGNEVDRNRTNLSAYIDGELDVTNTFLVALAGRFEHYSDFGSAFTGKLSSRLKLTPDLNLRGSLSTGFRAPSLAQIHYNLRFISITSSGLVDTLLASNTSRIAREFGINELSQEQSQSASIGFSFKSGGFTGSIDGYYTKVTDRIVLTGTFEPTPAQQEVAQANSIQFFANGVNTENLGLDFVATYKFNLDAHKIGLNFLGNLNKINLLDIKSDEPDVFFNAKERGFLKFASPVYKISLGADYAYEKFGATINTTFFGKTGPFSNGEEEYTYGATSTTDLNLNYQLTDNIKLVAGVNNLFNQYPDEQDPNLPENGGIYDSVQQGFAGSHYYTRISYSF